MIKKISAREILDSRGEPTIEVTLLTSNGCFISSVPSGASKGKYEAKELRDGEGRYWGKGVLKAIKNIEEKIAPVFYEEKVDPFDIDKKLISLAGENKEDLGANAVLGVSMCVFRAFAAKEKISLYHLFKKLSKNENFPIPCFNIINGGVHGGGGSSFQEFMLVPKEKSFAENLRFSAEFYHTLKKKIIEKYGASSANVGDEGGFVPEVDSENEVLSLLKEVDNSSRFIVDVAAGEFFEDGKYFLSGSEKTREEMISLYRTLSEKFNLLGIEDPLEEDDFLGWKKLKNLLGKDFLIIGDDLLATNIKRIEMAGEKDACNAMILKMNQIGTVSEALQAAESAREKNWKIVVSHRSGETNDDFVADFALGIGADFVKFGAPARGERVAKYNRLLKIEEEL